jgi:uncharacterized LabA/DUF88 family protein
VKKQSNNYAFIDSQNINLGVRDLGWKLDWRRFRVLLAEQYAVSQAYLFLGFLPGNQELYTSLQRAGFVLVFKPVAWDATSGKPKGNVDADLVLHAMIEFGNYDRAVIASSDGDFWCLVEHLHQNYKLEAVLSPKREKCSALLRRAARSRIAFLEQYRERIEYRRK